jgi:hypothetical protein
METTTTEAVNHLQAVGFTEYEARAYATLVQRGPLTGYQLAKASGIPRPNVYAVIDRLERRGAVSAIATRDGQQYAALGAPEMLTRVSTTIQSHLDAAHEALDRLGSAPDPAAQYVWNIQGYDAALARAETLVDSTQRRLVVGTWSQESARLATAIANAQVRGVEITTLCVQGCEQECGNCRGEIFRYPVASRSSRWLILVGDDLDLMVVEIPPSGEASAAHTSLPVFVQMAGQYLRTTIAAAEIVRSLGAKLPAILDRRAARALESTGLAINNQSWLQQLVAAVKRPGR